MAEVNPSDQVWKNFFVGLKKEWLILRMHGFFRSAGNYHHFVNLGDVDDPGDPHFWYRVVCDP